MNSYRCMLADCAVHLEAGRLTEGSGGNAYDCYQKVLALESGNVSGVIGIEGDRRPLY